jgi:xanthine dehydrogenase small subunit
MRDQLVFYVNGRRQQVGDSRALLTLTQFLRQEQGLTGTKVVCDEGDCGACAVLVGRPEGGEIVYRAIDSCVALLFQLDGCHVVTVEGLSCGGKLSPVQQAMVDCHGSQCGFCTPGFVTTLHGLVEAQSIHAPPTSVMGGLTAESLRYALSGNLCRCTGYQQIIEAGESINLATTPRLAELYPDAKLKSDLLASTNDDVALAPQNGASPWQVFAPSTLEAALEWRAKHPNAKIVSGATDVGVQRNHGKLELAEVLVLSRIRELADISVTDNVLELGAGATWTAVEEAVRDILPEYHAVLTRFGSPQIRNFGTIGGNFVNASPIADSLPLHLVLDAELELASVRGVRRVPITEFYRGYKQIDLAPDELLVGIHTPLPAENERVKLYKISKRRDMDISTVTAAIALVVDGDMITRARIALGGVGPVVMRMPAVEKFLTGADLTADAMREAGKLARQAIKPLTDVRGSADYRLQLVENLLAKSYFDLTEVSASL